MLGLYFACVVAFIVFAVGLAAIFAQMRTHGFELTEYWQLAVFGFVPSLAVCAYAALMFVMTGIKIIRSIKHGEDEENPVNLTKTGGEEQPQAENAPIECEDSKEEIPEATVCEKIEKPKKLTFRERRRQKLLEDEKPKKKSSGAFGVFMVCASLVFCCWFSVWAHSPNELCFHKYTYSEVNVQADADEISNYRFYQDALGRPYYIQETSGGNRHFKVPMKSRTEGEDASGKYVLYTFHTEEKYAKVLDCALENFSYLTVDIEVYYYKKDAHIVVNHTAIVERMDKRTEYKKSGKIYTYKKLIS